MVASKVFTADELLAMGEAGHTFELIRGELHEVSPSSDESTFITFYLGLALGSFVKPRKLGLLSSAEGGWRLQRDPDTVVAPDIGFVKVDRLPKSRDRDRYVDVVPDLAVEVVSPSDRSSDVLRKVQIYAEAGVPLVWVVYPKMKAVTVYRLSEPPVTLREGDVLGGDDVIPGFEMPVEEIFQDPLA